MRHPVLLTLCLLVVAQTGLGAQSIKPVECLDTASTQSDMTVCAGEAYKSAQRRLDGLLHALHDTLTVAHRTQLDSAQSAWSVYSSIQCRLENADGEGGSAYPMEVALCRASLVEQRIRQLAPMLCYLTDMVDELCPAASPYLPPNDSK